MPRIRYGQSSFERSEGDLPEFPVINMFAEETPTEEGGVVLQSRPGVADRSANMGLGPVRALFKRDGVMNGGLFGVSGGAFYSGTTSLGLISGSGAVSITGNEIGIVATAGQGAKYWNGVTLADIAMADGAYVTKVFTGISRFFLLRADTGQVYWTDPLGVVIDGLAFATAESAADKLLDGLFIDSTAVLFGAETVEFWPSTGDATLPIAPLQGRVFEVGIKATGCAVTANATFYWVGSDNTVYTNGNEPVPVSNVGLDEKIAASESCALWTFRIEATEFVALRIDSGTWAFSTRTGAWSEMQSYGLDNWLPQCWAGDVFGSSADGMTMEFTSDRADLGGILERRFRGGFPIDSGGVTVSNIQLRCNAGQTPFLEGPYAEPVVEMRLSRDGGKTWGVNKSRSLGRMGEYRKRQRWNGLGMFSQPGLMCEFRVTDPVPFRASDVLVNEAPGGR